MVPITDCIYFYYCRTAAGSKEHSFPAGLGGRRMNKGILCEACNNGFSELDGLLVRQLDLINGLIGVRPDHADSPKPARVTSALGPLTMDQRGQPAFTAARVLAGEHLADGSIRMSVGVENQKQLQDWIEQMRGQGIGIKLVDRRPAQIFLPTPLEGRWAFGGNDGFREIGRIAINFLATRWPGVARDEGLRPFKEFVRGVRTIGADEPRAVWYAPTDAFPLPESPFAFGHQVLVVLDPVSGEAYARVRLFSAFDVFVGFGRLSKLPSEAVLFDIDPLAERPPDDLRVTGLPPGRVPAVTHPPTAYEDMNERLTLQVQSLFARVEDRQWKVRTEGLLDAVNATRELPVRERRDRLAELLQPHLGSILHLIRPAVRLHLGLQPQERAPADRHVEHPALGRVA